MLLLLAACARPPEGPPPPPTEPCPVDTADWGEPERPLAEGGVNRAPRVTGPTLKPEALLATTGVRAEYRVVDPEGDFVSERLQWVVNGAPVPGGTGRGLPAAALSKGDRVELILIASDGVNEVEVRSEQAVVGNSPPTLLTPRGGLRGALDGFQVQALDPDGDPLTWSLVGAPPGLRVSAEGVITYAPQPVEGPGRRYEVEVRVEDPEGLWAAWPLTLDLKPGGPP